MNRLRFCILTLILLVGCSFVMAPAFAAKAEDDSTEIKMGNEAAAEVEKEAKIINDPVMQARLDAIGAELAAVANSTLVPATYGSSRVSKFDYTFKIVDDKEINAFALPGGHIYVNKGLMKFLQSDHELAGVLAHEVVHDSHHHMLALLKEQSKLNNKMALVLLAAIVGKVGGENLGNVVMGAQLLQIAKMSSYGVKAETDADRCAVDYLAKTQYNPVGLLTFIERLSTKIDLFERNTILQDHPPTGDRRAVIEARLKDLKIPISRRLVTNAAKAIPTTAQIDGKDVMEIAIDDKLLMRVADGAEPAAQRAKEIADKVNFLLDSDVMMKDVKVSDSNPAVVIAKNAPFLRIEEADAALSGDSAPGVARKVADTIRSIIWKQMLDLTMMPTSQDRNLR
jgi:beta-barrel assembly-enhancing protease